MYVRLVWCKATLSGNPKKASRWIQCQKSECEKWPKISDNDKFPSDFTYKTSEIDGVTCETPQDISCD